tara:strand:+ start:4153 stop:5967 length:1815 start_codon:yes stop_codon:yes gene_type:complete
MPIADVSDIIGKRNLVEETQGWMSLALQKKELALKELEKKKEDKLTPFEWEMANWGSDNPYFQEQLQDLSQDYYNNVYSMAPHLSINPNDMENCPPGSPCANAHRLKNTLDGTPGAFKAFQTRFKNDFDVAQNLIGEKDSLYYNQDNLQTLENAKGEWMNGFKPAYDQDGRLMAIVTETEKVPQKDENGNALYVTEAGDGTTTNKDDAKIGEDGNPVQATADQEVEKMITLDDYYDKLGISKSNLKKNASANDWNPETFSDLIAEDTSFISNSGVIDKNSPHYKKTRANLYGAIFGAGDMYNASNPEASALTANAAPIVSMMRNDPSGNFKEGDITEDQIIDYVIQNVMGIGEGGEDGDDSAFNRSETVAQILDKYKQDEFNIYGTDVTLEGEDQNSVVNKTEGSDDAIVSKGSFSIEHSGEGKITRAPFDPDIVTLFVGDNNFTRDNDKLKGLGEQYDVVFGSAYLCLWDPEKGKFLTKKEEESLKTDNPDAYAKCEYRPAVKVTFSSDDTDVISNWKESGLYEGSGSDGAKIDGIMPFDEARENIQGDFSKGSINYEFTEGMYDAANQLNEELRSGVITDNSGDREDEEGGGEEYEGDSIFE